MSQERNGEAVLWTAPVWDALRQLDEGWISEGERARAQAFRQPDDRERYVAARLLLRHALAEATGSEIAPETWRFVEGEYGKPCVGAGLPGLEFSVSHADRCAAVAVSEAGPVGVDVESARPDPRLTIVDDALTERERALLAALPEAQRWEAFLRIWTIKEACAKATGLGAALDFRALEVSLDPPRVIAPPQAPGAGLAFEVVTREAVVGGSPYRLSAAAIAPTARTVAFSFRSLTA